MLFHLQCEVSFSLCASSFFSRCLPHFTLLAPLLSLICLLTHSLFLLSILALSPSTLRSYRHWFNFSFLCQNRAVVPFQRKIQYMWCMCICMYSSDHLEAFFPRLADLLYGFIVLDFVVVAILFVL